MEYTINDNLLILKIDEDTEYSVDLKNIDIFTCNLSTYGMFEGKNTYEFKFVMKSGYELIIKHNLKTLFVNDVKESIYNALSSII